MSKSSVASMMSSYAICVMTNSQRHNIVRFLTFLNQTSQEVTHPGTIYSRIKRTLLRSSDRFMAITTLKRVVSRRPSVNIHIYKHVLILILRRCGTSLYVHHNFISRTSSHSLFLLTQIGFFLPCVEIWEKPQELRIHAREMMIGTKIFTLVTIDLLFAGRQGGKYTKTPHKLILVAN
jgi:hypothetical protein